MQQPDAPFSRAQTRVVLLEGISASAAALFTGAGYTDVRRHAKALEGDALIEAVRGAHVVGIRSRTQLAAPVLAAAGPLMAVGCFCIGTDQVDLLGARTLGIPVFNAPFSNTRSVAELTIGEIVMLLRRITPRSAAAHTGGWDKSSDGSFEVRGKVLGIVGYGNIGSQLSTLAEAMGMRVIYVDRTTKLRHGNTASVASLRDLLAQSHVVSLHVPDLPSTRNMIGAPEIAAMRRGAYLINNARGRIVDLDALAAALQSGHLAGAAIDVFPTEPKSAAEPFVSPLQGLPNVILTPHVGGSTEEAQERIGEEVAHKLLDFLGSGSTGGAVNMPGVEQPRTAGQARYLHVHRNVPGVLGSINAVFSARGLNVSAQLLQTDGDLGYVMADVDRGLQAADHTDVLTALCRIDGTIRARVLG
ncbi:MAG: phosphoglycerate dehydrogenase [Gemmatimonadaceae bacterium]|nr:phosphoglycerate dehydrogenase [Acetobacteraceae bacterium]